LKGEELATQIGIAAAWVIANPFSALIGLAAAAGVTALVASAMSSTPKTADDMIQPGYGKRILFSPEGSIAFNDKDTIVAGTNLKYGNDVISGPAGSIGNNACYGEVYTDGSWVAAAYVFSDRDDDLDGGFISFIVPNGYDYRVRFSSGSASSSVWSELR